MRALAAYRELIHRLEALAEPSDDGGQALQIEELAQMFGRGS
jgi:hypothetical protein